MDEYKWNSDDYQNAPEVTGENKTAENTECFSRYFAWMQFFTEPASENF